MKTQSPPTRRSRKTEAERAAIREGVLNAIRLSMRPLSRLDLYMLCSPFATEHYVRLALHELEHDGRVTSDIAISPNSGLTMLVYRTAEAGDRMGP